MEWIIDKKPTYTGYYLVFAPDYFDSEQGVAYWDNKRKLWSTPYSDEITGYVMCWRELPDNPNL